MPFSLLLITDRNLMAQHHGSFERALEHVFYNSEADYPAGAVAVLLRDKDAPQQHRAQLLSLAAAAVPAHVPLLVSAPAPLVAKLAGAGDVGPSLSDLHRPVSGMHYPEAMRLAPRNGAHLIGCSRHTVDGVVAASVDADYVMLGPWGTVPGKGAALGTAPYRRARSAMAANCRLIAVGGVSTGADAAELRAAGVDGVALIRTVWSARDPRDLLYSLLTSAT